MNNLLHSESLTSSIFTDKFFRFLVIILLFFALLYEQRNLVLISLLILAMFYIAKSWSYLSIKNIEYSFDAKKKKGFPGEWIKLKTTISNKKILPIWLKLIIPIDQKITTSIKLDSNMLCEEFNLLWYEKSFWNWKFTANQRGCFQIGPPFLETGDLFGFFQQKKYLFQSVEMIIYPKPALLNFLSTPVKELFGKPGLDSPVKDPVYPVATQDYYHGDPAKYIHWKASARHSRLQSKVFAPSSQRKTLIIIDVGSFEKKKGTILFEKTLEIVAAMIMEFDKQGNPFGIISDGELAGNTKINLSIATGTEQLSMAMESLARLKMKSNSSIKKLIFKEEKIAGGTGCIYCTYNLNKENVQIAEFLLKKHIPLYFIIGKSNSCLKQNNTFPSFLLDEIHGGFSEPNKNDLQEINLQYP